MNDATFDRICALKDAHATTAEELLTQVPHPTMLGAAGRTTQIRIALANTHATLALYYQGELREG